MADDLQKIIRSQGVSQASSSSGGGGAGIPTGAYFAIDNLLSEGDTLTKQQNLELEPGVDVQIYDAQLETLAGLSSGQASAIVGVTEAEFNQIQNIGDKTISNTQWGYLGALDQSLTKASNPTFNNLELTGTINYVNEENLQVEDKTITLNKNGTNTSSADSGIIIERPAGNESILWNSTGGFHFSDDITVDKNVYVGVYELPTATGYEEHVIQPLNTSFTTDFSGQGWSANDQGDFNINNLVVREAARFRELIIDELSIIAGSDLRSVARGKVKSVNSGNNTVELENPNDKSGTTWKDNDFFWVKAVDVDGAVFLDLKGQVTNVNVTNSIITLTLDTTVTGGSNQFSGVTDISDLSQGNVLVQRGHPTDTDRQALIYTSVSDSDAPVQKYFTGIDSLAAFDEVLSISTQIGVMDALTSTYSEVTGEGFFSSNFYATDSFQVGNLNDSGQDYLKFATDTLTWKAENTELDASGNLTATSADLSGKITATSGVIGGLTVGSTSMYVNDGSGNILDIDAANQKITYTKDSYQNMFIKNDTLIESVDAGGLEYENDTISAREVTTSNSTHNSGAFDSTDGYIEGYYLYVVGRINLEVIDPDDSMVDKSRGTAYLHIQARSGTNDWENIATASYTDNTLDDTNTISGKDFAITASSVNYDEYRLQLESGSMFNVKARAINLNIKQYKPKITFNNLGVFISVAPDKIISIGDGGQAALGTTISADDNYLTGVSFSGGTLSFEMRSTDTITQNLDGRYFTETEINNFFSGDTAKTGYNKSNWDTAHGWGNHATEGYLTSETDPTVPSHVKSITTTEKSNWDTAHGWGNHASAGYYVVGNALDSGSITSGFGSIDIGGSTLDAGVITSSYMLQSDVPSFTDLNTSSAYTRFFEFTEPSNLPAGVYADRGVGIHFKRGGAGANPSRFQLILDRVGSMWARGAGNVDDLPSSWNAWKRVWGEGDSINVNSVSINGASVIDSNRNITAKSLTVSSGSDGDTLLTFDTDRDWAFKQHNDDAITELWLESQDGNNKNFSVVTDGGFFIRDFATKTVQARINGNGSGVFKGLQLENETGTDGSEGYKLRLGNSKGAYIAQYQDGTDVDVQGIVFYTSPSAVASDDPELGMRLTYNKSLEVENGGLFKGEVRFGSNEYLRANPNKTRFEVHDSIGDKIAMGYLDGLAKNDGSGNWDSNHYGFWVKAGDRLTIDGDMEYTDGDWLVEGDATIKIQDGVNGYNIINLGTVNGEKGLFYFDSNEDIIMRLGFDSALIAGWKIDPNYIWTGTKKDTAGFTATNSSITIASSGAIRANKFRLETDGSAYFKGDISGASGTIGDVVLGDSGITSDGNNGYSLGEDGLTATKGEIGGWGIGTRLISSSTNDSVINLWSDNVSGSGAYNGTASGVSTIGLYYTPNNTSDRIYTNIGETYSSEWTGRIGFSLTQGKTNNAIFEVSAHPTSGALTAQIAGWNFTESKLYTNDIEILSAGQIWQTDNYWSLHKDGSGHVANKNLRWDSLGNIYVEGNANVSGTIGAGDESGVGNSFYAGRLRVNYFQNSATPDVGSIGSTISESTEVVDTPFGTTEEVSKIVVTDGGSIRFQAGQVGIDELEYGDSVVVSMWVKTSDGSENSTSHDINDQGVSYKSFSGYSSEWERIWFRRDSVTNLIGNYLFLDMRFGVGTYYVTGVQVEINVNEPSPYQPTDGTILSSDQGFGMWAVRGGFGGTIQNPAVTLTDNGFKGGILESRNYTSISGNFTNQGTYFDLDNGNLYSEQFGIVNGNAYFKGSINIGTDYWNSVASGGSNAGDVQMGNGIFQIDYSQGYGRVGGFYFDDNYMWAGSDVRGDGATNMVISSSAPYLKMGPDADTMSLESGSSGIYIDHVLDVGAGLNTGRMRVGTIDNGSLTKGFMYDGTDFKFMGNIAGTTVFDSNGKITNSNDDYILNSSGLYLDGGRSGKTGLNLGKTITMGTASATNSYAGVMGGYFVGSTNAISSSRLYLASGYDFDDNSVDSNSEIVLESGNVSVIGDFGVSGQKNFIIDHPNPLLSDSYNLYHSAVESPTAGDNLYRYTVEATKRNDTVIVELPEYFEYLNKDVDVHVSPVEHYGRAYGTVEGNTLTIKCETEGEYNVLVIGTRKDKGTKNWKGAVRLKEQYAS